MLEYQLSPLIFDLHAREHLKSSGRWERAINLVEVLTNPILVCSWVAAQPLHKEDADMLAVIKFGTSNTVTSEEGVLTRTKHRGAPHTRIRTQVSL